MRGTVLFPDTSLLQNGALKLPGNAGTSHGGRALTGRTRYRIMLTYMGS